MNSLNDKQEMFCREYIKDLNATQAAIRAGYSAKTAGSIANRLLAKVAVQTRINALKDQRIEEVKIDANYVLKRLVEIDELDIADLLDDNGNLLPIPQWSKAWRTSVNAIDIAKLKKDDDIESLLKKIKLPDKLKNLELIGKHATVLAFKDKLELTGKDGKELIVEVLSQKAKDEIDSLKKKLG